MDSATALFFVLTFLTLVVMLDLATLEVVLVLVISGVVAWFFPKIAIAIGAIAVYDAFINKQHAITKNFPVLGRLRYLFERFRPEIRQYFIEDDRNGLPFSRVERSYVYRSAKGENNMSGFGSDADFNTAGHFVILQSEFPKNGDDSDVVSCAKVMGPHRKKPYRPSSIINISAMSYGALGANATTANNIASLEAGMYHNTGEGGFSPYHETADQVVFQIGTGYFGCGITMADGKTRKFSMPLLLELVSKHSSIKAIEIKLSQGAKAGKGGVLPAAKVTEEIAAIRGVEAGKSVLSPAQHNAFSDVDEMIDFIEMIADNTGLPVGIKSAVGKADFWELLAQRMKERGKGPDFITIDGGEGGTGAAPVPFADHISLPFMDAFPLVYQIFQKNGLTEKTVFIASAKLGFPAKSVIAFAMGADLINIAREIMLSAGCIQAKKCHLGTCPAGIATHNWWLNRGFDVNDKSQRVARFVKTLRKDVLSLTHAAGYEHPSEFRLSDIRIKDKAELKYRSMADIYGYEKSTMSVVASKTA
jgi:glutamate synthase domain-containing protein 2